MMSRKKVGIRLKEGQDEFDSYVQEVYSKWDSPNADKDILAKIILRSWGDVDKMAWWEVCRTSKRWGRCGFDN